MSKNSSWAARAALLAMACSTFSTLLQAQVVVPWATLKRQPGVDATQVQWLEQHVPPQVLEEITCLVQNLSKPESVRVLPAFGALGQSREPTRLSLEPLAKPVPPGPAGQVQVIHAVAQAREAHSTRVPFGPRGWDNAVGALSLPSSNKGDKVKGIQFHLNLEPARQVLRVLASRDQDPQSILRSLQTPTLRSIFEALVQHRSQSFYGAPLSMEMLAQNLAWASSESPLMQLYVWANPSAFLNYGHIQRHRPAYEDLIQELAVHQDQIESAVVGQISPFAPPDATFVRTVHILFCGGTDGWASLNHEGVDLEFHGRNFATLSQTLVHETFHGLQAALGPEEGPIADPLKRQWAKGLGTLYREGTASYVEPCILPGPDAMKTNLEKGKRLLADLDQAVHKSREAEVAQRLVNQGTSGAGPFYWIGREMTKVIVAARGKSVLHDILREGTPGFFRAYAEAIQTQPDPGLLPEGFLAKAMR